MIGWHVVEFRFGEGSRGVAIGFRETPAARPPGTTRVRCVRKDPEPSALSRVIRYGSPCPSATDILEPLDSQEDFLLEVKSNMLPGLARTAGPEDTALTRMGKGLKDVTSSSSGYGWVIGSTRDSLPWIIGQGEESLQYSSIFST